jgi:hypothetical protein
MDTDKKEVVTPLLSTLFYTVTAGMLEPRPNSWTKSRQKSSEFSSLLFKVTSNLQLCLLNTVKEKGGKPDEKPHHLSRNLYKNLKSDNSQDYAQKPQRNCTFMNSASGVMDPDSIGSVGSNTGTPKH